MVKHKFMFSALSALLAVGVVGAAVAGTKVLITGAPYDETGNAQSLQLSTGTTAVRYGVVGGLFTAQVDFEGFLFCNHVGTGLPTSIHLAARHGAWNFGSVAGSSEGGVIAPVSGISLVDYNSQTLTFETQLLGPIGGLQCYMANKHGRSASDLNHIFVGSFDSGATAAGSPNTSSVAIAVTGPLPDPMHSDQGFSYTITVLRGNQTPFNGQNHTQSETSTDYYLNEGYDTHVFESCNIVPGQPVPATSVWLQTRFCKVKAGVDMRTLGTDIPVVSAALFTGPSADEKDFSDNLAFGYP